jgi:hypothetical protein
MNGDPIRDRLRKQPFDPFEIHMSSGDVYPVKHPEQALVTGANVYIWYPEIGRDHVKTCSLLHITSLEHTDTRPKKKGGKS